MRWFAAPLIAALFLTGSGFMSSLERTTEAAARLAETSKEAQERTASAAEDVANLPQVADLTRQQADAFQILADALDTSAVRVDELNDSVAGQLEELSLLVGDINALDPYVSCAGRRLRGLIAASSGGPGLVDGISSILAGVNESQGRSIRHLKSINRKLTILGIVATGTGAEPPPPPGEPAAPEPGAPPPGRSC